MSLSSFFVLLFFFLFLFFFYRRTSAGKGIDYVIDSLLHPTEHTPGQEAALLGSLH